MYIEKIFSCVDSVNGESGEKLYSVLMDPDEYYIIQKIFFDYDNYQAAYNEWKKFESMPEDTVGRKEAQTRWKVAQKKAVGLDWEERLKNGGANSSSNHKNSNTRDTSSNSNQNTNTSSGSSSNNTRNTSSNSNDSSRNRQSTENSNRTRKNSGQRSNYDKNTSKKNYYKNGSYKHSYKAPRPSSTYEKNFKNANKEFLKYTIIPGALGATAALAYKNYIKKKKDKNSVYQKAASDTNL